jgi:hypothetical protein
MFISTTLFHPVCNALFLGLAACYVFYSSIISVLFRAVCILLGVKNVSIQCHSVMKFRVGFHDVQTQSATQVNLAFSCVHYDTDI